MKSDLRALHETLLDLTGFLNRPQPDQALLREAGIGLERALFPLLVRIERRGPIGIVELADVAGRDHSTVSRQVDKLVALGLVTRHPGRADRRTREVAVSAKGRAATAALDAARERLVAPSFGRWSARDRRELVRLLRRFVDELTQEAGVDGQPRRQA